MTARPKLKRKILDSMSMYAGQDPTHQVHIFNYQELEFDMYLPIFAGCFPDQLIRRGPIIWLLSRKIRSDDARRS